MKDEQRQFLSLLGRPPARLSSEQVGWLLNFSDHDVPVLVGARLLKPLGNPPPNGVKYFAEVEVRQLASDRDWLARATNAIHQHWQKKNQRRSGAPVPFSQPEASLTSRFSRGSGRVKLGHGATKTQSQSHSGNGAH